MKCLSADMAMLCFGLIVFQSSVQFVLLCFILGKMKK
jgi:hypothetical protein